MTITKLSAALLGLVLVACTVPARAATHAPSRRCATVYMRAMTHTDFGAMYACMGGDLRHRLEERADARNEGPVEQLAWDQARLELAATGHFKLLKERLAPVAFQLRDEQAALLYRFETAGGDMGVVLLLDHRGYVSGLIGPFYASG